MDYRASWSFANFPPDRREHLASNCPSYCQIIHQIGHAMKEANIRFEIDPGYFIPVDDADDEDMLDTPPGDEPD